MPKHPEAEQGQRDRLGEEHPADIRRQVGEGITNISYDDVLEESGALNKW